MTTAAALLIGGWWMLLIAVRFGLCRSAARGDQITRDAFRDEYGEHLRRTSGGWKA